MRPPRALPPRARAAQRLQLLAAPGCLQSHFCLVARVAIASRVPAVPFLSLPAAVHLVQAVLDIEIGLKERAVRARDVPPERISPPRDVPPARLEHMRGLPPKASQESGADPTAHVAPQGLSRATSEAIHSLYSLFVLAPLAPAPVPCVFAVPQVLGLVVRAWDRGWVSWEGPQADGRVLQHRATVPQSLLTVRLHLLMASLHAYMQTE